MQRLDVSRIERRRQGILRFFSTHMASKRDIATPNEFYNEWTYADQLSRYAFPPLLNDVIAEDIDISKTEIAISNIIALVATLLVRLVSGTACDRFGPSTYKVAKSFESQIA